VSLAHADELIELHLDRGAIPVLRVLNQEDHKEGHDRGAGVDDELPGVGVIKVRATRGPGHDGPEGQNEHPGAANLARDQMGEIGEELPGSAPRIAGTDRNVRGLAVSYFSLTITHGLGTYAASPAEPQLQIIRSTDRAFA